MSATQTLDQPTDRPRLLTTQEAALEIRREESTVRRLVKNGKLPGVKVGGRYLVFREELEKMLTPARGD